MKGNIELGRQIRLRRNELGLTVGQAAEKAGVGVMTWSRYESGDSIRQDKYAGICRALDWHDIPRNDSQTASDFDLDACRSSDVWPKALAEKLGESAAISFVVGSDLLLDSLEEDLEALSAMPKGSHIGEQGVFWLTKELPQQFLMRYDYEFLYLFKTVILRLRLAASRGEEIAAHSVIEELALYLIMEHSRSMMEGIVLAANQEASEQGAVLDDNWDGWAFQLFGNKDLITNLYADSYLQESDSYHFDHWQDAQF